MTSLIYDIYDETPSIQQSSQKDFHYRHKILIGIKTFMMLKVLKENFGVHSGSSGSK